MSTRELLQEKRDEILALAAKHKAHNVRVFGSVVRGEDGPESDVDFLVEFEEGAGLFDQIGFELDLGEMLGREVDVVEDGFVHHAIRDRVTQEAEALDAHGADTRREYNEGLRAPVAKDARLYLFQMRDALQHLVERAAEGEHAFLHDRTTQDAALYCVGRVGRNAAAVDAPTRGLAPGVPWDDLAQSGSRIITEYDQVDLPAVWQTVISAPHLLAQIDALLKCLSPMKER